jgi:glycosyltransferase involved in cell wall biosynthesis
MWKQIFTLLCFLCFLQTASIAAPKVPRIGLVVSAFNRPEYLSDTLQELQAKSFGNHFELEVILIDDHSEEEARRLVDSFHLDGCLLFKVRMPRNSGISKVLTLGWGLLSSRGCDFLCNLDSDVALKDGWLEELLKTYQTARSQLKVNNLIVTGFNTKNHPVRAEYPSFLVKDSVGGINLFFPTPLYRVCIAKALASNWFWDWEVCKLSQMKKIPLVCTRPSVIQHMGAIGVNSEEGNHDYAEDF